VIQHEVSDDQRFQVAKTLDNGTSQCRSHRQKAGNLGLFFRRW
jgi:hypothetical protein